MEKKTEQKSDKVKTVSLEQLQIVSGGRRGRGAGRHAN